MPEEGDKSPGTCLYRGETLWSHSEKAASASQGEALEETKPADTLKFQPPELWEINFCCLSHPVYGVLLCQFQLTNSTLNSDTCQTALLTSTFDLYTWTSSNLTCPKMSSSSPPSSIWLHSQTFPPLLISAQPSSFSDQKQLCMVPLFLSNPKSSMPANPVGPTSKEYPDLVATHHLCCYHSVQATNISDLNFRSRMGLQAPVLAFLWSTFTAARAL